MAKLPTCPKCQQEVPKGEGVQHKRRTYHKTCIDTTVSEVKEEKVISDYQELINYCCQLLHLERPTGMVLKQIKTFKEEPFNYTYKGMLLTLKYFYETLHNSVTGDGVGIIPYVYDQAKKHHITLLNARKHLEKFEEAPVVKRVVKTKIQQLPPPTGLVDIGAL